MWNGVSRQSGASKERRSHLSLEQSTALCQWFVAHADDPCPSEDETQQIAEKLKMSITQVTNWFSNVRKRHGVRLSEWIRSCLFF